MTVDQEQTPTPTSSNLGMEPSSPSDQTPPPRTVDQAALANLCDGSKKRKLSTESQTGSSIHVCWQTEALTKDIALKRERGRYITLERDLDQRVAETIEMQHKVSTYEGYLKVIYGYYQAETAKAVAEKDMVIQRLTEDIKQLQMQGNIDEEQNAQLQLSVHTRSKIIEDHQSAINNLKVENTRIRERVQRRDQHILYLKECLERVHKVSPEVPSVRAPVKPRLAPSADEKVRQRPDYKHENAPRNNDLYGRMQIGTEFEYRRGQGRLRPEEYGSNRNWDLGLCHEHFTKTHGCRIPGRMCPLRHHSLSKGEQTYMGLLGTAGSQALHRFRDMPGRTEPMPSASRH